MQMARNVPGSLAAGTEFNGGISFCELRTQSNANSTVNTSESKRSSPIAANAIGIFNAAQNAAVAVGVGVGVGVGDRLDGANRRQHVVARPVCPRCFQTLGGGAVICLVPLARCACRVEAAGIRDRMV